VNTLLLIVVLLAVAVYFAKRRFDSLTSRQKKNLWTRKVNRLFWWLEDHGLMGRTPAFDRDYEREYHGLRALEVAHPVVKAECLKLLEHKDQLTDVKELGAGLTKGGIHKAQWKAFMFKSGEFIEENCALAPRTAELIRRIPNVYTAFFSIVDPKQYITPHWGYYKGFLRYHLGVIIPNDNADHACWIRINADPEDNAKQDQALIENGETYYWHEGEGILFDDNYLHDAKNDSDEVRVVLWLDLCRKMPFYAQIINRFILWVVYRDEAIVRIREGARVAESFKEAA
jgi:beta-hydroxylase